MTNWIQSIIFFIIVSVCSPYIRNPFSLTAFLSIYEHSISSAEQIICISLFELSQNPKKKTNNKCVFFARYRIHGVCKQPSKVVCEYYIHFIESIFSDKMAGAMVKLNRINTRTVCFIYMFALNWIIYLKWDVLLRCSKRVHDAKQSTWISNKLSRILISVFYTWRHSSSPIDRHPTCANKHKKREQVVNF